MPDVTSPLDRRRMPFKESRLYRQAAEFAQRASEAAAGGFRPVQWIRRLGNGSSIRFDTLHEGRMVEGRLEQELLKLAASLDHRHLGACLLEACSRHYDGPVKDPFTGPAMKTALAISCRAWQAGARGSGRSWSDYWDLVTGCVVLNQIEHTLPILEAYGDGRCEATDTHMDHDEGLMLVRVVTDALLTAGPPIHRSLFDFGAAIVRDPTAALQAIVDVLRGASPWDQPAFQGTVLARMPVDAIPLWIRLFVRVHLAMLAREYREEFGLGRRDGLFVFETFAFIAPEGLGALMPEGNDSLFWRPDWLGRRWGYWRSNLLVERPVVELAPGLFATSPHGLLDSAAWMVEAGLYHLADAREVWIDDAGFQAAISQPFEANVRAMIGTAGFRGGWITERGRLRWSDGVELALAPGCPGEIDAVADANGVLWVLECKSLQLPFLIPGRLRDMISRLSADDSHSYHAKLAAKVAWLQSQMPLPGVKATSVRGAIVLDRPMPGMLDEAPHAVVDAQRLAALLAAPDDLTTRIPMEVLNGE